MLEIGLKGKVETVVSHLNTAKSMGSGDLDVFATPCMIALMEKSANESILPFLEDGQGSVGTLISTSHISPTALGGKVTAESEIVEIDRKRIVFRVKAFDDKGLIGEGRHERFIIDNKKFMSKIK